MAEVLRKACGGDAISFEGCGDRRNSPKSVRTMWPSSEMRMFSGLRSLFVKSRKVSLRLLSILPHSPVYDAHLV